MSGLTAANFTGEFRNRPVTIVSAALDTSPRRVALVVDVSASQFSSLGRELAQAAQVINGLAPSDAIALFTINGSLRRYSDFTTDRDALQNGLRDVAARAPDGTSSLYDGIIEVAAAMAGSRAGDAICLFGDGDDDTSHRSLTDAARALATRNIRMFVIGEVVTWDGRSIADWSASRAWATVTQATGGWLTWLDPDRQKPDDIARASSELAAMITSAYRLEINLSSPVDKPRDWKLEVLDATGHPLKKTRLLYPHLLGPSASH